MELRSLLSDQSSHTTPAPASTSFNQAQRLSAQIPQQHNTIMSALSPQKQAVYPDGYSTPPDMHVGVDGLNGGGSMSHQASPVSPSPKHVAFELLLDEVSKARARIPMRVQIFPHDTTDSIVTTVKNFYGIYEGAASGVSFEDENGNTLIARYENLRNNMTVYVRVISNHAYPEYYPPAQMDGVKRPSLGEPFQMPPPQPAQILDYGQPPSRPTSRVARKRSVSPSAHGRRSASVQKGAPRGGNKSRGSSIHGSFHDEAMGAFSDSDGGHGSVSGSKKARSEQFASSDISMDNILQDGRRKRPKFDSSELPLFVPPQVPLTASTSSISPQRHSTTQDGPSPFAKPIQRPYAANTMPSPQSYGHHEQLYGLQTPASSLHQGRAAPQHGHRLRERTNTQPMGRYGNPPSRSSSHAILPTPDPTIASCISDEDVAMQLIRLGDASNFSHGRNSTSTIDDGFSRVAEVASSAGASSDGVEVSDDEDDLPPSRETLESSPMLPPGMIKKQFKNLDDILPSCDSTEPSSDDADGDYTSERQGELKSEYDDYDPSYGAPKAKRVKTSNAMKAPGVKQASSKTTKTSKNRPTSASRKNKSSASSNNQKTSAVSQAPVGNDRKSSSSNVNFQHQLADDEEDLSAKPRCQRCRKSKKGCDRQRPCGRCRDAGIGIEGCISEDEGNGRKGRYGRHMGVAVKKAPSEVGSVTDLQAPVSLPPVVPAPAAMADKNKKRKR